MNTSNTSNKKRIAGKIFPAILIMLSFIFFDQLTKYLIVQNLELGDSIPILNNVFEIHYIQNPGAAWGVLANKQILFAIITCIVLVIGSYIYIRCAVLNQYRDLRFLTILILSGAIGNFIDRIRLNYVIDFLYFKLINFPVFNVADCYVTIGFFLVFILIFFKYKDSDFETIFGK